MKIIRESLNEIRRSTNTSSLSDLGIGAVTMCRAYEKFEEHWPRMLYKLHNIEKSSLTVATEAAKLLHTSTDSLKYINSRDAGNKFFLKYYNKLSTSPGSVSTEIVLPDGKKCNIYASAEWGVAKTVEERDYYPGATFTMYLFKVPR